MPPKTPSPTTTPSPTPASTPTPAATPLTKPAHSTSNSPVLRSIQSHLNLTHNDALFTALRATAHTLLTDAGILLASANDQAVQIRKRQVAHELEKLHPEVFAAGTAAGTGMGTGAGGERTYEMRKNTSYALLTLTMDVAKRRMKRRRGAGAGAVTVTAEEAMSAAAVGRGAGAGGGGGGGAAGRRNTPSPSPPPPLQMAVTSQLQMQTPLTPLAVGDTPPPTALPTPPTSSSAASSQLPTSTSTSTPTPPAPQTGPTPPTILIPLPHPLTPRDCCRVQLCDLTDSTSTNPTLRRLHECLREDGLSWECGEYVILDSDGVAVRNDRGLRCALGVMAARGLGVG
ncbi:hypothetical protein P167DRAFT_601375, partial [Morchella conica CCBAS932]